MKQRETNIINLLKQCSDKVDCEIIIKPQLTDYKNSQFYKELNSIYKKLDGTQNEIPFNIGNYDCIVNRTIVELDEENHFNRYRATTLQAGIYKNSTTLKKDNYLSYCNLYET